VRRRVWTGKGAAAEASNGRASQCRSIAAGKAQRSGPSQSRLFDGHTTGLVNFGDVWACLAARPRRLAALAHNRPTSTDAPQSPQTKLRIKTRWQPEHARRRTTAQKPDSRAEQLEVCGRADGPAWRTKQRERGMGRRSRARSSRDDGGDRKQTEIVGKSVIVIVERWWTR
jgi:hypothetical protein